MIRSSSAEPLLPDECRSQALRPFGLPDLGGTPVSSRLSADPHRLYLSPYKPDSWWAGVIFPLRFKVTGRPVSSCGLGSHPTYEQLYDHPVLSGVTVFCIGFFAANQSPEEKRFALLCR